MADVTFRELCLDATDPHALAAFWAGALHRTPRDRRARRRAARRRRPTRRLAHLGRPRARAARPARPACTSTSACPRPTPRRWSRSAPRWCASPATASTGGCSRTRRATPSAPCRPRRRSGTPAVEVPTPFELVVDCADPEALAGWWAARFGVEVGSREGKAERWLQGVPGFPFMFWVFAPVPGAEDGEEPAALGSSALDRLDPSALVAAGATVLREPDADDRVVGARRPRGQRVLRLPADRLTRLSDGATLEVT